MEIVFLALSVLLCSRPAALLQSWKFPLFLPWAFPSILICSLPLRVRISCLPLFYLFPHFEEAKRSVENGDLRAKCVEGLHVRKYLYCVLRSGCGLAQHSRLEVIFPQNVEGSAPTETWPMLLLRSSVESDSHSKSLSWELIFLSGKLLRSFLYLWLFDGEPWYRSFFTHCARPSIGPFNPKMCPSAPNIFILLLLW